MTRSVAAAVAVPTGTAAQDTQDIDDFIYLMSHDVRASVRALLELPQWISEDLAEAGIEVTGSVAQSIEMMNRHTARLDRMLTDLLAYSRVGRLQEVVRVDLDASLEEVLSGLCLPDSILVTRDFGCRAAMMGEQDALMLWSALIGNAVKHHDKPAIGITVKTRQEGGMIRITVCDDGPGIPQRFYSKALGAMTTLRPRDEIEGTGMGLANVRKLAQHYGGSVELSKVQSDQRGLRVDVVIPHGCATD
ncbi:sensor histidine kinase [Sulfitobacter guttiformis]|uniref:histidine kinase n=1 Tax=Sulfitobacter guttiformis TaxID=74349 RepID=A0A420DQA0_9RHOB|nr:HAMP domain-containing sensor histidine kinase [Sulfitobacter guttiformis]KIN73699.1 Histidine kinase [Sulfitobacter guttiformis KCTC 32187]RKE96339.1 histidine kinase/DNA gyrase B/HSP90-like ATPase [Sulfitobacter guttiformis]